MGIVKKIIKKIIQIITWLLFILLIFAIYSKIQMIVLKQNYSTFFGYTMFQVVSGSMEPTLNIDDVILVKIDESFKENDIIAYLYDDSVITHRVLAINGDAITVKGDANNTIDSPINRKDIIGKVVKIYPELRIWQKTFTDPKILLALFLTLLLFDYAFSYKRNDSKQLLKSENSKEKVKPVETINPLKPNTNAVKDTKDVIEADELLTLTTQIDLTELNEILRKDDIKKINCESSKSFQELKDLKLEETKEIVFSEMKVDKISEYTVRLDLRAIQKNISKRIK